jgi:hypothetical protein
MGGIGNGMSQPPTKAAEIDAFATLHYQRG